MKDYKISLAGDLGSGKSTVGAILAEKYALQKVSIGQIQRKMAADMQMTTVEFNRYMEQHPEFDDILDGKLREYENISGRFIFDSRMAWHFVPSSFAVYMTVEVKTAAERIMNADRAEERYSSIEEGVKNITERRKSEKLRYKTMYGVDITDMTNYNLVVSTDGKTPDEVANEISNAFEVWLTATENA